MGASGQSDPRSPRIPCGREFGRETFHVPAVSELPGVNSQSNSRGLLQIPYDSAQGILRTEAGNLSAAAGNLSRTAGKQLQSDKHAAGIERCTAASLAMGFAPAREQTPRLLALALGQGLHDDPAQLEGFDLPAR